MVDNGFTLTREGKQVLIKLHKIDEQARVAIRSFLFDTGKLLVRTSKAGILHGTHSGRFYKYKNRMIQASAGGEYAASRSGKLWRGLDFDVNGYREMVFGNNVDYAEYLENAKRIEPRPSLGNAVDETESDVLNLLKERLNSVLLKGAK